MMGTTLSRSPKTSNRSRFVFGQNRGFYLFSPLPLQIASYWLPNSACSKSRRKTNSFSTQGNTTQGNTNKNEIVCENVARIVFGAHAFQGGLVKKWTLASVNNQIQVVILWYEVPCFFREW